MCESPLQLLGSAAGRMAFDLLDVVNINALPIYFLFANMAVPRLKLIFFARRVGSRDSTEIMTPHIKVYL